jgi:hypothetical protein
MSQLLLYNLVAVATVRVFTRFRNRFAVFLGWKGFEFLSGCKACTASSWPSEVGVR